MCMSDLRAGSFTFVSIALNLLVLHHYLGGTLKSAPKFVLLVMKFIERMKFQYLK